MNPQTVAFLPFVTPVATLIVLFVGVLFSNRHVDTRISDLRSHMDSRFGSLDQLFQERLRRVEEVMDARLSRIEEQLHMR
jgi:hypothetical protein